MESVYQVSAGGVAHRVIDGRIEIVVIKTSSEGRWQLPKGMIDPGETAEIAALREVHEEAGITCEIIEPIDVIEYWFVAAFDGPTKRYHKKVHFYLMKYLNGDVNDHDHEVVEARWVTIVEASRMLAFDTERELIEKAKLRLEAAE
ncbi:MAG TPA: NUDIX hydrolase [Pyrinomonadaceae bacterium]|nr:NUDIX hydrolase [Pyrinomonadaceae bacterium]